MSGHVTKAIKVPLPQAKLLLEEGVDPNKSDESKVQWCRPFPELFNRRITKTMYSIGESQIYLELHHCRGDNGIAGAWAYRVEDKG